MRAFYDVIKKIEKLIVIDQFEDSKALIDSDEYLSDKIDLKKFYC